MAMSDSGLTRKITATNFNYTSCPPLKPIETIYRDSKWRGARWRRIALECPSLDQMHDDWEPTADANMHPNDRCTRGNCRDFNQPERQKPVDEGRRPPHELASLDPKIQS
jgi:hypothetical protein